MKKLLSLLILLCITLTAFSGVGVLAAKEAEPEVQIASFAANGSFEKLTADGKPEKWNLSSDFFLFVKNSHRGSYNTL